MPSLIPGFEYDIFISYRHNDNLDGWVTDFVQSLDKELKATLKEPLSIYLDKNPHNGLLETHNVDKSLEGKLKCLIFIPIISQTYCDTKSFAWLHEFCAFNKLAKEDSFGRDIKLNNGNVASRILPIKIHDLDEGDKSIIEHEIGGVLRSIEFIFKSAGVNRPLRSQEDHPQDNLNTTFYRDQVNKVANAIKEIVTSLRRGDKQSFNEQENEPATVSITKRSKRSGALLGIAFVLALTIYFILSEGTDPIEKSEISIAVLPFTDMSPGKDQEYLGDGIAEDIITTLSKIQDLKVVGRTSSFQFKGEKIDLREIGDKLNVSTVLEGSIMKSGNRIRITAQLINVHDGTHIWSERYDKPMDDIFAVQDDISSQVVEKFKLTLNFLKQKERPTNNIEAYEWYLRGRQVRSKGLQGVREAIDFFQRAIEADPAFIDAYLYQSETYFDLGLYNLENKTNSYKMAKQTILKALELDPNSARGYSTLSLINTVIDWDWDAALLNYEKAVELNNGQPIKDQRHPYVILIIYGRVEQPLAEVEELLKMDPLSVSLLLDKSRFNLNLRRFPEVLEITNKIQSLSPDNTSAKRHRASAYFFMGEYGKALTIYNDLLQVDSSYVPYGNIATLVKLNRNEEAQALFKKTSRKMSFDKLAMAYIYLNKLDSAYYFLNKAYEEKDVYVTFINSEPYWDEIRNTPQFNEVLKKMNFPNAD